MGRQPLWRRVEFVPRIGYFKPAGVPLTRLQEERLSVEEAEAIRLKDLEGLELEVCARRMNISRTTFSRVLGSARQRIADALLSGKAIRIEGGNFEMSVRRFRCINGHEWDVAFEVLVKEPPRFCLKCKTPSIMPLCPTGLGWGIYGQGKNNRFKHSRKAKPGSIYK